MLVIDVSDILKEVGSSKEFSGAFLPKSTTYQGESIEFKEPFSIEGNVTCGNEGILIVQATVKGEAILQCGSCMELYSHPVDISFTAEFRTSSGDDPDIYLYTGHCIDLEDAIMDNFFLELPTLRRCSEDCKGLCPYCGANLNNKQCTCEEEKNQEQEDVIDSRLAVLKEFFSARDKEV